MVSVAQLYNAYLDESGTHAGSRAVVVAGFVSNVSKWEAFSEQWSAALNEWGVSLDLIRGARQVRGLEK